MFPVEARNVRIRAGRLEKVGLERDEHSRHFWNPSGHVVARFVKLALIPASSGSGTVLEFCLGRNAASLEPGSMEIMETLLC